MCMFQTSCLEPKKKDQPSYTTHQVASYGNFTTNLDSLRMFYYFIQAFKANMKNPLYVGDFCWCQ